MSLNENDGCMISLNDASDLTKEYRAKNPNETLAHYFGKKKMNDILGQSGVIGFRVYYGLDDNNSKELVIVGVDSNGDDMTGGLILDCSKKCPPICSKKNQLNS